MPSLFTRRHLWTLALPLAPVASAADPVPALYPVQPLELAREMVGASHANFQKVQALVSARPSLVTAAVDWGFGDWEDALGAASHVGNRQITEFLLAHGARPSLFSAAMLGQLDVVKAFLAALPGAQKTTGPHSISLLAHAKAGGKPAEAVYQFLDSLGDAGSPPRPPLSPNDIQALTGAYTFGPGPTDRIEITQRNGQLRFLRLGATACNLIHLGNRTFHPVGAPAVRIRFSETQSPVTLTIEDPGLILTALRS